MKKTLLATSALAAMMAGTALVPATASAQEIRFMCYSDGNECEVYDDVIDRFEEANPGVTVAVDVVPYKRSLRTFRFSWLLAKAPTLPKSLTLAASTSIISIWSPMWTLDTGKKALAARSIGIAAARIARASTACIRS